VIAVDGTVVGVDDFFGGGADVESPTHEMRALSQTT
jgi:hypothetical protein